MPPHNLESFRNAIDFSNRFQNGIWKLELLSSLSTQSDILQLFNSTFWVGILDDKGTNMVATANRPEKSCVCCSSLAGFSKISTSNFGCYIDRCFHFVANLPSCSFFDRSFPRIWIGARSSHFDTHCTRRLWSKRWSLDLYSHAAE